MTVVFEVAPTSCEAVGLAVDVDPTLAIDRGAVGFGEAEEGVLSRHQGSRAADRKMPQCSPLARRDGERDRRRGRPKPSGDVSPTGGATRQCAWIGRAGRGRADAAQ